MFEVLLSPWSLGWSVGVFAVAAVVTVIGAVRLAALGDQLADRTGWGEALFGAVFFGIATSLSGIVMTATAAATGQPELGYSNAVGGIAAQTTALAAADAFYRRSNLEHAAASLSNVLFGCLLIALLVLVLIGRFSPEVTVLGIHPVSGLMVALYLGGLRIIWAARVEPLWRAVPTDDTRTDEPDEESHQGNLRRTWLSFLAILAVVAAGGWAIARAAEAIMTTTGLSASFVGVLLLGVVNALPETVTAVAAVRRGALTLAVSGILGGNTLDALNVVVGDVAYRSGSLYHAATVDSLFVTSAALLMTVFVLAGLLVRQSAGWGRIGFEGSLLVATYAAVVLILAF